MKIVKEIGIKLPPELVDLLNRGDSIGVLATFSDRGVPHTTPLQIICPKPPEAILVSIYKGHRGYRNMVWQKKVAICFMCEDNITYTILGRAGVVRAPSLVHPLMHVVQIDVIEVHRDSSMLIDIDDGVCWSYTSPEAKALSIALLNELRELKI